MNTRPMSPCCAGCSSRTSFLGPVYSGSLHSTDFVSSMMSQWPDVSINKDLIQNSEPTPKSKSENIRPIVSMDILNKINPPKELPESLSSKHLFPLIYKIAQELDTPLSYNINEISRFFKVPGPSLVTIASVILNAGYLASRCHTEKPNIKTDAPSDLLYEFFYHRALNSSLKCTKTDPQFKSKVEQRFGVDSPAAKFMLNYEPKYQIDDSIHPLAKTMISKKNPLLKYPTKPRGWGPKKAAQGRGAVVDKDHTSSSRASQPRTPDTSSHPLAPPTKKTRTSS